jgi:hypothetical protein
MWHIFNKIQPAAQSILIGLQPCFLGGGVKFLSRSSADPNYPQKLIAIHELRYGSSVIWSTDAIKTDNVIHFLYVTNHWCNVLQRLVQLAILSGTSIILAVMRIMKYYIVMLGAHRPVPVSSQHLVWESGLNTPPPLLCLWISESVVQTWVIQIPRTEDFFVAVHFIRLSVCSSCSHFKI